MMSGGRIAGFRAGWALAMSFQRGKRAHWFERDDAGLAVSSCGSMTAYAGQMFHVGTWKACKRCARKHGEPTPATRAQGMDVWTLTGVARAANDSRDQSMNETRK